LANVLQVQRRSRYTINAKTDQQQVACYGTRIHQRRLWFIYLFDVTVINSWYLMWKVYSRAHSLLDFRRQLALTLHAITSRPSSTITSSWRSLWRRNVTGYRKQCQRIKTKREIVSSPLQTPSTKVHIIEKKRHTEIRKRLLFEEVLVSQLKHRLSRSKSTRDKQLLSRVGAACR